MSQYTVTRRRVKMTRKENYEDKTENPKSFLKTRDGVKIHAWERTYLGSRRGKILLAE